MKMDIVDRAKKIILLPKEEWAVIDEEEHTVKDLYTGYVMILAAIPAVAGFIGYSVVGIGGYLSNYNIPISSGIAHMVIGYLFSLGTVYLTAVVIDAFAPTFETRKNFIQAFKLAVFSSTAIWLAGIFSILPALMILGLLGLYSLYLLYVGLPLLMNVHPDRVLPYFMVIVIVSVFLNVVVRGLTALAIPGPFRGF
jgi:hypothetical protein